MGYFFITFCSCFVVEFKHFSPKEYRLFLVKWLINLYQGSVRTGNRKETLAERETLQFCLRPSILLHWEISYIIFRVRNGENSESVWTTFFVIICFPKLCVGLWRPHNKKFRNGKNCDNRKKPRSKTEETDCNLDNKNKFLQIFSSTLANHFFDFRATYTLNKNISTAATCTVRPTKSNRSAFSQCWIL